MPISEDNKLMRTRKSGFIPLLKKEPKKEVERDKSLFDINDYQDPFFNNKDTIPGAKKTLIITVKENI